MDMTTRGKTDFRIEMVHGLLWPYKQKERTIRAFLTGTPKMTHNLECLQITLHYIQSFTTNKKSHETKDLQNVIFYKIEDYHPEILCSQGY